jgi:hypothetical protein
MLPRRFQWNECLRPPSPRLSRKSGTPHPAYGHLLPRAEKEFILCDDYAG